MKQILALLLAVALLFCMTACGEKEISGAILKYDLTALPRSLDPQLAVTSESLLVVENTFEALLRQGENGELVPGVATGFTTSADGLTYTFSLREDARWQRIQKKTVSTLPVRAQDFVFAFRRVVDPVTGSAGAASFLCIEGARDILTGKKATDTLGVTAPDDYTLVVKLEKPNPFFPALMASAAAMPCNEEFFLETKGRYGLEVPYTMSNGPFYIKSYDPERRISLRANPNYHSATPTVAGGVDLNFQFDDVVDSERQNATLKTGEQKVLERFYSGKTDAAAVPYHDIQPLTTEHAATVYGFENTVWGIAFNCNTNTYGNESIRRAFALSMDFTAIDRYLTGNLRPANAIVPAAVQLLDTPYRQIAGENLRPARDPDLAKQLFNEGLAALGVSKLSKTSILCPDFGDYPTAMSVLQRQLQDNLGIFVNLEPLPQEELSARVRSGDYMLAVLPLVAGRNNPDAILESFADYSTQNVTGYSNALLDKTLNDALTAADIVEAAKLYAQAERLLLNNAVFCPIAYETSYNAASATVQDLIFSPFSYKAFFKFAYQIKK